MALVICTGVDPILLNTRRLILEQAGHTAINVTDENALVAACSQHPFVVAVIGQAVTAKMKRRIAAIIREHCPAVKILELYDNRTGHVLDDADDSLLTPAEVPKDLADRVDDLARQAGQGKPNGVKV
ncbi:MAG TPA: hypothetical protein VFP59_07930 [Candidatus Angelobacter sp.]|nr:hypothetical protein [Candidatus Angelobacter sp.]